MSLMHCMNKILYFRHMERNLFNMPKFFASFLEKGRDITYIRHIEIKIDSVPTIFVYFHLQSNNFVH